MKKQMSPNPATVQMQEVEEDLDRASTFVYLLEIELWFAFKIFIYLFNIYTLSINCHNYNYYTLSIWITVYLS